MDDKDVIQKFAVERCRMHVAHLRALQHLLPQNCSHVGGEGRCVQGMLEAVLRDLALIDDLIGEQ